MNAEDIGRILLFEDDDLIVVNKPYGYFVHKSSLDATSDQILMYPVRDYTGCHVYPIHRLDRKTTGILLFAKNKSALAHYNKLFEDRKVDKTYLTICRGFLPDSGTIDYALKLESGKVQDAITSFKLIEKSEIPVEGQKFPTSRFSLAEFYPETGRMHQIRKHAAHIFHPIVADRPHGCNKLNKVLIEQMDIHRMVLHALSLEIHQSNGAGSQYFFAPLPIEFILTAQKLGFNDLNNKYSVTLFSGQPKSKPAADQSPGNDSIQ